LHCSGLCTATYLFNQVVPREYPLPSRVIHAIERFTST
jgi:hypothetical protein